VSSGRLTKKLILNAFEALSEELAARATRGELFVVGGAAIALAYSDRRVTRDIDAIFEPKAVVYAAAQRVAERLDLPDDWLNDAVKSFAPGTDPDSRVVFSTRSLEVAAASPRYLLAMKLLASRVDQDTDDIKAINAECGFTSADEGLDLVERLYPGRPIAPKTQFLLEELFGPASNVHEGRGATQT
jgi:hypothetical protein